MQMRPALRTRSRLLTPQAQFDSYKTMSARSAPYQLAPGQFERITKALADARRFAILESIAKSDECPYQRLCDCFPVSKATISHHMKELIGAGLVESERDGQFMNARLRPEVIEAFTAELHRRLKI